MNLNLRFSNINDSQFMNARWILMGFLTSVCESFVRGSDHRKKSLDLVLSATSNLLDDDVITISEYHELRERLEAAEKSIVPQHNSM